MIVGRVASLTRQALPVPTAFTPLPQQVALLYVLYLDESGTHGEASHFVLAGLAVFEREIHWFGQDLDLLQEEYFPSQPPIHFHATKLRGRDVDPPWDTLDTEQRRTLKERVYGIIRNRRASLFACAVENNWASTQSIDTYEHAFEQVVSRFDMFLSRTNRAAVAEGKEEQRGLLVVAESSFKRTLGVLARRMQTAGTRWGTQLHNVTDVPLFASPTDTRLLQFADFCSNAVYGRYHSGLTRDFDQIAPKFDQDGGVVHGLVHHTSDYACACLACFSRSR